MQLVFGDFEAIITKVTERLNVSKFILKYWFMKIINMHFRSKKY